MTVRTPSRHDSCHCLLVRFSGLLPPATASRAPQLRTRAARAAASRVALGLGLVAATGFGLFLTNPGPAAFEEFAGERLTAVLVEELCGENSLPMMIRLVIRDCRSLVRSQSRTLGRLASLQSRRRDFGILTLYRTDLGGQTFLSGWTLPRYRTVTLAAAGRFLVLSTDREESSGRQP